MIPNSQLYLKYSHYVQEKHKRLLYFIKQYRLQLFMAMGCMLLVSGSTAASAYLIKPVLDDIFVKKDISMLGMLPIAIIIVYFFRGFGLYGQEYFMNFVGQRIIRHLRDLLYETIIGLSLSFFYTEKTGVLMSRITNDVSVIKNMVSSVVTTSIRDCFTIVFLVFVIFYQIWELALIAFVVLPVAFYPILIFGRKVRRVSTGCQESMAELNSFLHETFAGNKIVKAFGMEEYEKNRFFIKSERLFHLEMKAVIAKSLSSPVMECLAGVGIAFILWFGGSRVIQGTYTVGTYISFLAAVIMLYEPVKKMTKLNNALQEGLAAVDRVFDILDRKSNIQEKENAVEILRKSHTVTFDHVSFKYDQDEVLKDIQLHACTGEVIALVGPSGGGKTSLVNLIPRFYDVTQGAIYIDDIDIRNASIDSVRKQIAIVSQEPILFNDTIRNNIAYGNLNASEEDIEAAARSAYAFDFIKGFPKGFQTFIGELGNRLSGGEKQRICIARALLKNAPILILDEATSALDTESEMLVQKALDNLMQGRTTFVIAHRLSTVAKADLILVIKDGRIVEQGKHDSLLTQHGEYAKLYALQFSNTNIKEKR
ncbi:MAG: ATP-binding cassette domain-containing protein [Desulfobacterales bacterium]|nr:ATP-binding cassette domain-containing protein [Desulfobacterales bacterium]